MSDGIISSVMLKTPAVLARNGKPGAMTQRIGEARLIAAAVAAARPEIDTSGADLREFIRGTWDPKSEYNAGDFSDRIFKGAADIDAIEFVSKVPAERGKAAMEYLRTQFALLRKLHKELSDGYKKESVEVDWIANALWVVDKKAVDDLPHETKDFLDQQAVEQMFPDEAYIEGTSISSKLIDLLRAKSENDFAILLQIIQGRFGVKHFANDDAYFDAVKAAKHSCKIA